MKEKKFAEGLAKMNLYSVKWVLFPIYMDTKVVRIRVGSTPPSYEKEWILASTFDELKVPQVPNRPVGIWLGSKYISNEDYHNHQEEWTGGTQNH